jgi:hypothetical protein
MHCGTGTSMGYHDHYVVDGGNQRNTLAAPVTPVNVMKIVPLRDFLWRVWCRRRLRTGQMTGDTTYGTAGNIVALEVAGIRAYVLLLDFGRPTFFCGMFGFTYDAQRDEYHCPQGQPLPRHTIKSA